MFQFTKQLGREPQKASELNICYPQMVVTQQFTRTGHKEPVTAAYAC